MGKTMESVFWHEVGHLIADFNNQDKLGIENFEIYMKLECASKPIGRSIETSWGGETNSLIINIRDSIDFKEKVNKCAMRIACLAYGPILESIYLRQKQFALQDIIKECWDLPNVDHAENYKKDKSAVRRILLDLDETEPTIKAAWQAKYSNQINDFGELKSVIDAVNEKIKEVIYSEAYRLNDLETLTKKVKTIYVGKYLNEISENHVEADIALIKGEIFSEIKNEIDFNNFVRKIKDVIFNYCQTVNFKNVQKHVFIVNIC